VTEDNVIIHLRDVRRIYRMGTEYVRALDGLSLKVRQNEYVAIMGQSGSGKSTLMNLIGCLDRATSGFYALDGRDTTRMGNSALAQVRNEKIGFVFQSFELLPKLNAIKNVELPLIYARNASFARSKKAKQTLKRVGLGDRMRHRPNQLSGGEKQRVAVARALVNNPSILLADEPTGNLDSRTSREILGLFDDLHNQGQTIIMVTHESDVACHANRIVRMLDGRVLSDLPVKEDEAYKFRRGGQRL
jgi:putative ABC transport system ATP-binding protein